MVLLNYAIREQRRDPKLIENTSEIIDPNFAHCEPDTLSPSFGGFSHSLLDCEDLDVISEWICEPDFFEMTNNQDSSFKLEEKQVREEFSPISFSVEGKDGVSTPSEMDNVGAKFGEVCLDGHGGLLSEEGYFGDSIGEKQFLCGKDERISSSDRVCRVSVGGEQNSSSEICVADNNLVESKEGGFEECCSEKVEARLHGDGDFGQPTINCVEAEEIIMGTSNNIITSGDGVSGVSRTGALHIPKEEYVEAESSARQMGDVVERVVLDKAEGFLKRCGGFEHGVANDEFSIVETDEILKEASHNVNLNGGGVPGDFVTGPPTILYDLYLEDTNLVQRMGDTNEKQTEKARELNNTKVIRKECSDVESGEIVSYEDKKDFVGMEEADRGESGACVEEVENEEEDTGMVESDSEYCSDSSSSSSSSSSDESVEEAVDDEEIEEGEIKPEKGRRKVQSEILDYEFGSSDEEGPKGPIRSKNEIQDLPPVPPVTVVLEKHHQMKSAGVITSVLGTSIVVEGKDCRTALNEGTILWITEKRLPLGLIDEVFGPVKNPYYLVRFNAIKDVPDFVKDGVHVSYVPEFSKYVLNDPSLYRKGYDASGDNDEELSEEIEFSDDEKEAEYKRARSNAKRGAKSRQNALENKSDRAWKKQEFMDKRKTKLWGVKSPHNGNDANGLQGRIQETKFSSNKQFVNSSRNLPAVYNNGKQQSPQHLGPQSASVNQVAVMPKESENLWHGQKLVSGATSSWGRVNLKPNHDVSGGIHSVQVPAVGGQSACSADHKVNSSSAVHSRALHDQVQGINFGQPHLGSMRDQMGQTFPVQLHAGQPSSSAPFQQPVVGINSNQSPMIGGPMLNGNLINMNPMGFPSMPMFPALLGQPAQSSSLHPGSPVMAWNVGQPNNAVGGSQLPPQNAYQGVGNPLHFNQMQTCVGIPVLQNPGFHTMQMNRLSNMGAIPGHNVLPCPMPWGQPIPQGNLSQQFQTQLPSQNHGVSFPQSNNVSGNIHRLPHPSPPAKDRQ